MFCVDELLSKRNKNEAMKSFRKKRNDDSRYKDFEEYWKINEATIENQIKQGIYKPDIIKNREIINGKGKRRQIAV